MLTSSTTKILIAVALFIQVGQALSENWFEKSVGEIQVHADRVRIYVGTTYGTCASMDGWWGWSTGDSRHKDWFALVLFAQAQDKKIVLYDAQSACSGPGGDTIGIEALFVK